ncbi:hybrid sensor histidine kinase/response regulator [Oscillatoriales cyanobacterium LEGE 11467]|uniref:histidine kinase n=1 Tax=Zarconia navalis LEGE 11467 TaxID=1828826 RepID=A0A928Z8D5_9CYAN|nr:hybrid sensor histidine kinase/response regulator [Zarconia navalis]MBE9040553.1 hybrid sensor histidine kinase/response regulator [Zarconia navalis LEGE 11467]
MTIEDRELRTTFRDSSQEHLQKLNDGLLYLEKHSEDLGEIEVLVREIHTLKSEAAMLELRDIATLSHQIEHILGTLASGERVISAQIVEHLGVGLDAIGKLVREAVSGEPSGVKAFYVLASLMGAGKLEQKKAPERTEPISPPLPQPEPQPRLTPSPTQGSLYIDDDELRHTFEIACEEHLQKLESGVLHLEARPDDFDKMEELLREIHSIKGDAGMLGVHDIVPLAHAWEQQLIPVKEEKQVFSSQLSERLYEGLDAIGLLTREAVTGEASGVDIAQVLTLLTGDVPDSSSGNSKNDDLNGTPVDTWEDDFSGNGRVLTSHSPSSQTGYRIDTIRVATSNLDALMTQTGELTVTKIRIAHRLSQIEAIANLWEEWNRDAFANRLAPEALQHKELNGSVQPVGTESQRTQTRLDRLGLLVNDLKQQASEDTARLETISSELEEGVRTLRLLPLSTIFNLFPRMVRDLAKRQGKEVEFAISGGETQADKRILEEIKDPLLHILRNAIDHGIETIEEREKLGKSSKARLRLQGRQIGNNIIIEVTDDGRGLDLEKVKKTAIERKLYREEDLAAMTPEQIQALIFMPGFSTRSFVTEISGRGVGLDVVRANVERLKGSVSIESTPNRGSIVRMQLGTTLATAHVLLVAVDGITYALPIEFVHAARSICRQEIFSIEGRDTILMGERPISIVRLADLLELEHNPTLTAPTPPRQQPCIILKVGPDYLGLLVDSLLDEQDAILKPQSRLLKRVRNISGATILGTGEVCMVLDPQDLLASVRAASGFAPPKPMLDREPRQPAILLVEDSIATRTQEKRILEGAGYEVVAAVDGLDGLKKLPTREFDAVVSDIQMPNLDGLALTSRIRSQPQYSELPIILVTSLATDDDRRKGAQVGANAYITKSSLNQDVLLETIRRLV